MIWLLSSFISFAVFMHIGNLNMFYYLSFIMVARNLAVVAVSVVYPIS